MDSSKRPRYATFDDDISLPDDLVQEILSKLPSLDSAARLSCVCKSWHEWIKEHQRRVFGDKLSTQIRSGCLMVFHRLNNGEYHIRSHNSENICPVKLPQEYWSLHVVGECNGILCLKDDDHRKCLHLYNPITREYLKIPLGNYYNANQVFGFGFDTRNNDYKVIHICECGERNISVDIYKLGTNYWIRDVVSGFDSCYFDRLCMYVNGSCYWLYHGPGPMSIASLDFETEKFGHIKFGLPIELNENSIIHLGVLDDSLALCKGGFNDKMTQVWVMSESDSSWTEKFTVQISSNQIGQYSVSWVHDNDLFQVKSNGELHATNFLTEEEREAQIGRTRMFKVDDPFFRTSVAFKPTLVSLSSGIFFVVSSNF